MAKQAESVFLAGQAQAGLKRQGWSFAEPIAVTVILGSPKHDCAGQGICRVDGGPMRAPTLGSGLCNRAAAIAGLAVNGQLELHFEKASLCPRALRRHFGNGTFQVDEPALASIPQWWRAGRYIQPGEYAITESEHCYTVRFELGRGEG